MPKQEYLAVWNMYLSAWSDISAEERARRLESCVAADCIYTDPTDQRQGRNDLIARIEISKEKYPGAHFENDKFLNHHDHGLCNWTMYDGEGKVLAHGTSYSRIGKDRRLKADDRLLLGPLYASSLTRQFVCNKEGSRYACRLHPRGS